MRREKLLELLGQHSGGNVRVEDGPVRHGLLTSREVAIVLATGLAEAVRAGGDASAIRSALVDVALVWRKVHAPALPSIEAVRVLAGVAAGLALVADDNKVLIALRWLSQCDALWEFLAAGRGTASRRMRR